MMDLGLVIAACVEGAVVVFASSLWFADRVLKRQAAEDARDDIDPEAARAAIEEKRNLLRSQRSMWEGQFTNVENPVAHRNKSWGEMMRLDTCLAGLADEEAKIPRRGVN